MPLGLHRMAALLEGFKSLGLGRLITMAAVAGAMLLLLAFLATRGAGSAPMALLYADMDLREAAQVADQLDRARIAHEVGPDGTRISVPAADVPRARLLLAKEGLPSGGSIGYEIFDRGDGLTASQFQQAISQTRAMEGELARSIRMISGVRGARVHLVLPKREPFARDRQEAQASVVLTMAGAARMDREGVQSVLNLVASAVPGLRPQNVGIIDSRGNLLARAGELVPCPGVHRRAEHPDRRPSSACPAAVEDMLERSVGRRAGSVRRRRSRWTTTRCTRRRRSSTRRARSNGRRRTTPRPTRRPRQSSGRQRRRTTCRTPMPGPIPPVQPGAAVRGDDQLRDRQDGAHHGPRPAAPSAASAWPCWWTRSRCEGGGRRHDRVAGPLGRTNWARIASPCPQCDRLQR